MSFLGGSAPSGSGGFVGRDTQPATFARAGPMKFMDLEEATDLEQLRKDIEDGQEKIIEKYLETFLDDPT